MRAEDLIPLPIVQLVLAVWLSLNLAFLALLYLWSRHR